jgi:hypothetical protein
MGWRRGKMPHLRKWSVGCARGFAALPEVRLPAAPIFAHGLQGGEKFSNRWKIRLLPMGRQVVQGARNRSKGGLTADADFVYWQTTRLDDGNIQDGTVRP